MVFYKITIYSGCMLFFLMACQTKSVKPKTPLPLAQQHFQKAILMIKAQNLDSALMWIDQALANGYSNPMDLVTDGNFYQLVDEPNYRSKFRALIQKYATDSHAEMVRKEEPGFPISVLIKILSESDQRPIQNVSVELVHTDLRGNYFEEKSLWNPRMFAYLKTNKKGEVSINTIKPGSYSDDNGASVPAHIHYTLTAKGYKMYASEFTFENDPILLAAGNVENVLMARQINERDSDHFEITLYMQEE